MQKVIDRTLIILATVLSFAVVVRGADLQGTYEPTGIYAPKSAPPIDLGVRKPVVQAHVKGLHTHTCPRCGNSWSHGAESFGSTASHRCSKCGTMVWEVDNSRRVSSPVVRLAPVQSGCPNGHCPASNVGRRR